MLQKATTVFGGADLTYGRQMTVGEGITRVAGGAGAGRGMVDDGA